MADKGGGPDFSFGTLVRLLLFAIVCGFLYSLFFGPGKDYVGTYVGGAPATTGGIQSSTSGSWANGIWQPDGGQPGGVRQ